MILWRTTITFCIHIYKNLNNLNPEFMKDLFRLCAIKRGQGEKHKFDLRISNPIRYYLVRKAYAYKVQRYGTHCPIILKLHKTLQFSKYF